MTERISGKTKLLGLIGSPVGHSASPAMYNYSFEYLGLDYIYLAFDVKEENAGDAVRAMRTLQMRGGNVTMPDKIAVMKYLDRISPEAELIGAVNTIVNEDGMLTGYCTDGIGFVLNLEDHGISVRNKKVVIAGAGGAGTAIQVQCALSGAKEVVILKRKNKTFEKALQTAERIRKAVPECHVQVYDQNDEKKMTEEIQTAGIFVNATNVGMAPNADESVIHDLSAFHPDLIVADAVYNPLETRLLREAREAGCRTIDGKGMLLWQGVKAFSLFTGKQMPVEQVRDNFFR